MISDNKLKIAHDANAASVRRILQLQTENAKIRERLLDLEAIHGTYEQRIENERKHAGSQYKALKEKYDREVESRKALEERLKALDTRPPPRRPRSQNRGRGKAYGFLHLDGNVNANAKVNGNPNDIQPKAFTSDNMANNFQRRTSRVPLPVRPSTPIRPTYNREPGSSSSTLVGSIHSTFSRASLKTNESFSSTDGETIKSSPPDSPTTLKPPTSPVLEVKTPQSPVSPNGRRAERSDFKPHVYAQKPSWASLVARSVSKV
jgi:hypothetical protein